MRRIRWAAGVAVVALAVAGCGTSAEDAAENTSENNAQVCESLEGLEATFQQVRAGAREAATSSETVTVSQAQEALGQIADSWDDVRESAGDLSESVQEQMDIALSEYQDALGEIDDDDSLVSAGAAVSTAQSNLRQSYQEILGQLGC